MYKCSVVSLVRGSSFWEVLGFLSLGRRFAEAQWLLRLRPFFLSGAR